MEIKFTNTFDGYDLSLYEPKPASKFIPDWYKDTPSYFNNKKSPSGKGDTSATVKRCMPVFDALNSGYIIPTYTDVYVSHKLDDAGDPFPWYEWPETIPIGFHPVQQAEFHPAQNGFPYPKWFNPWAIKLPKGYSALFVPPLHHPNKLFTVLPGVVDCDEFTAPVNFPFVLNDISFEGMIPAGTPMVQVIPFKRDSWKMSFGEEAEVIEQTRKRQKLRSTFFDGYKTLFRSSDKEYK